MFGLASAYFTIANVASYPGLRRPVYEAIANGEESVNFTETYMKSLGLKKLDLHVKVIN